MIRNSKDKHVLQTDAKAAPKISRQWPHRNPRIVRVPRSLGGKDRHSKVSTVRGLRDRRVRLSVPTAIQLYDLQERLGLNQPSKVVDWLLNAAQHEINKLPPLQSFPPNYMHSAPQLVAAPHDELILADQEFSQPAAAIGGKTEHIDDDDDLARLSKARQMDVDMNEGAHEAWAHNLLNNYNKYSYDYWEASNRNTSYNINEECSSQLAAARSTNPAVIVSSSSPPPSLSPGSDQLDQFHWPGTTETPVLFSSFGNVAAGIDMKHYNSFHFASMESRNHQLPPSSDPHGMFFHEASQQ